MDHFDKHNILTNAQHGFRKKTIIRTATYNNNQRHCKKKLEKGSQVDIILLHLAKAFDKVPHHHLLHKLEFYGLNHTATKWMQSVLKNRMQSDILKGAVSSPVPVLSCVPGQFLVLTYINNMPETSTSSETKLFADDSLLRFRTLNNQADSNFCKKT
ncbi:Hypothetical predicted protein [Mytilus galloprovincialis]|uniref:Reverse transcriptase domain-containing protein n=1 Tax=Mytilus galloprovincialis TaxID=29158 RepID=A0A8B6GI61_MYTGA|nr:Hypothetical predicted protein [Mytilus galloprovincialis]